MRLRRRQKNRPPVVFVDEATGDVLPLWAIRAGMGIVATDYCRSEGPTLRVTVRRDNAKLRWDEDKPIPHQEWLSDR